MAQSPDQELIYRPAKRGNVAVLIMIAGPAGSGKTKSALRLARGLAGPDGLIGFCDTEHGRGLYYADEFEFQHLQLEEPFNPLKFEHAALASQRAGHLVWICDSFSHEHVGPGGILDMFEAELKRMTRGDDSKREGLKYTAWIKPKGEHKHLVQRLWQMNLHIILCCHAEMKLDLVKDKNGKNVPNPDRGFTPVCSPDIPYAMTVSFLLDPKRPGVPMWLKRFDKIAPLINMEAALDEATGERIAAWARGEKRPAPATKPTAQVSTETRPPPVESTPATPPASPPAATPTAPADAMTTSPPPDSTPPASAEPPPSPDFPGDMPAPEPPVDSEEARIIAGAKELEVLFDSTEVRKDHSNITDQKKYRDRLKWLQKHRKDLYEPVGIAIKASWDRTTIKRPAAGQPDLALAEGTS